MRDEKLFVYLLKNTLKKHIYICRRLTDIYYYYYYYIIIIIL